MEEEKKKYEISDNYHQILQRQNRIFLEKLTYWRIIESYKTEFEQVMKNQPNKLTNNNF